MVGKEYLINKLNTVSKFVKTRYEYYNNENVNDILSIAIPAKLMQAFNSRLGWCAKAVDLLADRLTINRFANDNFNIWSLYENNNADILISSAIKGALISGCDFIYIYKDDDKNIKMQVVGGKNATGVIDTTTSLLTEGYAVLSRDAKTDTPTLDAYFTEDFTEYHNYNSNEIWRIPNSAGYCLLVPIINSPKIGFKEFGMSRISKDMMNCQNGAEKLLTEIKILAEVNSWPQKWVTGLAEGTEIDSLKATFASLLRFDKDDDGDRPTLGQFTQMNFSDHVKMFDTFVSIFSGMSSLTRDDLGFVTENPSSAESKKAALESLRVIAGKCQRDLSIGFINAGFVANCYRDDFNYSRSEIKNTEILWKPLVEPDSATLSSIGDGLIKINQAVPGFFDETNLEDLIGIKRSAGVNDGGLSSFNSGDFE